MGDFNWWLLIIGVVAGGLPHVARPGRVDSAGSATSARRSCPPRPRGSRGRWRRRPWTRRSPRTSCGRIAATSGFPPPDMLVAPEDLASLEEQGVATEPPADLVSARRSPRRRAGLRVAPVRGDATESRRPAPRRPARLEAAGEDLRRSPPPPIGQRDAERRSAGRSASPLTGPAQRPQVARPVHLPEARRGCRPPRPSSRTPGRRPRAARSLATATSSPVEGENSSVPMPRRAPRASRRARPAARRAARSRARSPGSSPRGPRPRPRWRELRLGRGESCR